MRKLVLSILIFLLIGGCEDANKAESGRSSIAKKIAFSKAAGESVLLVGGEAITSKEIIELPARLDDKLVSPIEYFKSIAKTSTLEEFKKRAKPQLQDIVTDKISEILLYQEAKRQIGKKISDEALDKAAEKEVRRYILDFGGDEAKAIESLKQMGMDRNSFKEKQKRHILTKLYIPSKFLNNSPITYTELVSHYYQIRDKSFTIPATIQFRLIDIQPAKLQIEDPNQSQLDQAIKLTDKLVEKIKAGEDFGELARHYSHGYRRDFGGLWNPVQPDSLAKPYDILAAEAQKLQPSEIAGPLDAEGHIFIMKLEDKHAKSYEPFEKVQKELEQMIISERRQKATKKLNAELMQQIVLDEKDAFIDFCLEKIYTMSRIPSQTSG